MRCCKAYNYKVPCNCKNTPKSSPHFGESICSPKMPIQSPDNPPDIPKLNILSSRQASNIFQKRKGPPLVAYPSPVQARVPRDNKRSRATRNGFVRCSEWGFVRRAKHMLLDARGDGASSILLLGLLRNPFLSAASFSCRHLWNYYGLAQKLSTKLFL